MVHFAVRISRFEGTGLLFQCCSNASNAFSSLNDFNVPINVSIGAKDHSICLPHILKPSSWRIQSSWSFLPFPWAFVSMQEGRVPPASQWMMRWWSQHGYVLTIEGFAASLRSYSRLSPLLWQSPIYWVCQLASLGNLLSL